MIEPLFLNPVFHEKIWGGDNLKKEFGYDIPSDHTGEAWVISAHPHGPAAVENGDYAGVTLDKLWAEHRELFGNAKGDVFPLLTKILDANDDLSVQVHPDDKYAEEHEHELGKTECWYIISAKPGAELYYGHNAKNREELADWINNGKWDKLLRKIPVKAGEFYYVPSGTIHALGKGIMVLETQQSSDTTYRLYDFDRVEAATGKKRELHLQQSIDVTTVPHTDPKLDITESKVGDAIVTTFVQPPISKYFTVQKVVLKNGTASFKNDDPYRLFSVLDGEGKITVEGTTYPLKKGQHFILPSQVKEYSLDGTLSIIVSAPGK
ncbi:mannose-6-phosphate isomerase, class I [Pediococcus claussenii]|uniref:Mannose-6-phosphate isomerase n=1 Tax=Pediococcus claussenii (strain ATCC BAA-344 / DSM 14800 / JCM 18046 / KCTC 3811 / LMG 21948 / P06) TaxID=701521 RepID=G8PCF7_PEDCP|nr:mannose-6-phosphate isomerase, class I [Pediococcus claussenii]AEV94942.1 mannose-6-phosphate isomerase, class I [Pediococcus claussenii ATCC BAA-344]ANZ70132.1 mannose-6-phosphate isomerase [Pediococcus claussenii]ANZ71948.1 mannose-6-phosphate isomerase [Pediococcus claussenii]KRN19255.1 manA protein [Pediococcus claussenii]